MLYRPTIYHLLRFIAPILEGEVIKPTSEDTPAKHRRSLSSSSSVTSVMSDSDSVSVSSRAAELISNKSRNLAKAEQSKRLPADWEKKQVKVILKLGSVNAMLVTDRGLPLLYASITGVDFSFTVSPALIAVSGGLEDINVWDMSEGCGYHSSILSILRTKEQTSFIALSCTLYSDVRYPNYPGYPVAISCTICAPSVSIRMRYIDELKHYFLAGPIADGLALLSSSSKKKEEEDAKNPAPMVPLPKLETIIEAIDDEETLEAEAETEEPSAEKTISLKDSIRESILLLGKNYLIMDQKKLEDVPFELPLINVVINNFQISLPVASDSQEMATFEMGRFTVQNQALHRLPSSNEVDRSSVKSTLNTVRIAITQMKASTCIASASGVASLALLGGIDLSVVATIANQAEINACITKMALTMNERQLTLFAHIMNGNFKETAVVMEDEIVPKEKKVKEEVVRPPVTPTPLSARRTPRRSKRLSGLPELLTAEEDTKKDEVVFGKFLRAQFSFDGVCLELLSGYEGYDSQIVGQEIYNKMGSLKNSISSIDIGVIQASLNLRNTELSAGISLSHVVFTDTRSTTSIDSAYRVPLSFGAHSKPAISALVSITERDIRTFKELEPLYGKGENTAKDIQASVAVGSMRVIATPWIFDIVDILQNMVKDIKIEELEQRKREKEKQKEKEKAKLEAEGGVEPKEVEVEEKNDVEEKKDKPPFGPHISADLRMENPVLYIIEDPSKANSSSFIVSLAVSASAAISPLQNVDAAVRISDIRCCRSHPSDAILPPPGLMDALSPFDININVHSLNNFSDLKGTLMTNHDMELRIGVVDVKLLMNAYMNLLPFEVKERLKEKKAQKPAENVGKELVESKKIQELLLNFKVMLNSFSITVVNDTCDYEIPIMMIKIGDVGGDIVMTENDSKMEFGFWMVAEYYNVQLTVWEPVLEKWDLKLQVNQEKRDRIVYEFLIA